MMTSRSAGLIPPPARPYSPRTAPTYAGPRFETAELLRRWSTWQTAEGCAASTVTSRATRVRILERHAGIPADEVMVDHVLAYIATVGTASTKATYYSHLRAWFGWLVRAGYREDDPTQMVRAPRAPRREPRPVQDVHVVAILETRMHHRTRAMVLLGLLAGLRVHEIAKVRGEDVDVRARLIRVVGKGGVAATLPMPSELLEVAKKMPRTGWWFPTNTRGAAGGHVLPRSVTDIVRYAMQRAGVPGSAHSLRHWYGTTLVDDGADLRTVQTLLRHASLATTQIYTAVNPRTRTAAAGRLSTTRSYGGLRLVNAPD